ncbi:MAG: hypothetical protein EOO11_07685 [Chitinophagaceae bacterium]|nr:MAG: hypothetical protein EOO11_07685 [Chitinophagaceae bacterium]
MQTQQFQALNADQQLRHLLLDGACIGERVQKDRPILLFQLRAGFVEVFFNKDGNHVVSTRRFRSPVGLTPYL